uniref:SFRICE_038854 n=1 Tax=Spodoptera frugiperda TaxID=7108 RepID=A0A2H1WC61_SPOFR
MGQLGRSETTALKKTDVKQRMVFRCVASTKDFGRINKWKWSWNLGKSEDLRGLNAPVHSKEDAMRHAKFQLPRCSSFGDL